MLSPHPASFAGGLSLFLGSFLLSAFGLSRLVSSPDFRVSAPFFPTSLFRFFRLFAFGLSRLVSLPGFSGSGPVFPDFHVPVFPASAFGFPGSCPLPGFSGSSPVFSDLPVPVFPASASGYFRFLPRSFPAPPRLSQPQLLPSPVFPGRGCRPGILNLFPAPFFPGRLPAPGFSAVFSGTPTAAAHPPRG